MHSVVKLHDEATQMFVMVYYVRIVVVCWLLDVPETCWGISRTDLRGQFYVLPH